MAIEVIEGKININGSLKEVGAKIKMNDTEEKRLVDLGFAKYIDETEKIEVIEDIKTDNKKGGK